jgi:hypothetical protein
VLRGTLCAVPFFVRWAGRDQIVKSSESSSQVMPATSPRRCPVRISKRMIGPKGADASPAACQISTTSASLKTRSRLAAALTTGNAANGLALTEPRFTARRKRPAHKLPFGR